MTMLMVLQLLGGFVLLVIGAEILVRGAAALALAWGMTPLVVGLSVVAFGTSAPEVAVSVQATLAGQGDLAIGNIVGSNLFNVLIILGLSALLAPLLVGADLVRRDIPVMIATSAAVCGLAWLGVIGRLVGVLLLVALVAYTLWLILQARREPAVASDGDAGMPRMRWPLATVLVLVGLGILLLGSDLLIKGAVATALAFEVSELVIGLTIIAAGTSFPELATSAMAALRGQRDIAIGNVVGSNIFNLLGVLGLTAVVGGEAGLEVKSSLQTFDLPLMFGVALLCWPLCRSGFVLTRGEGAFLVLGYLLYTCALLALALVPTTPWPAAAQIAAWSWLGFGLLLGGALALRAHSPAKL